MLLHRYEVKSPTGKSFGLLTGGYDASKGASILLVSNQRYRELREECLSWLYEPHVSGQYWFTDLGNELFQSISLSVIEAGILKGWNIVQIHIEAEDSPLYQDIHQACF